MNNKEIFLQTNKVGFALCFALLGALTGCVGYVDGPGAGYSAQPGVAVVQDDYVYYPQYECYYSVSRHQYAYRNGRNWVSRPAPRGVSESVLRSSPSVRMNFHDAPAQHHAEVARQYPKNWKPSGAKPDQNRKGDQRAGDHGK